MERIHLSIGWVMVKTNSTARALLASGLKAFDKSTPPQRRLVNNKKQLRPIFFDLFSSKPVFAFQYIVRESSVFHISPFTPSGLPVRTRPSSVRTRIRGAAFSLRSLYPFGVTALHHEPSRLFSPSLLDIPFRCLF